MYQMFPMVVPALSTCPRTAVEAVGTAVYFNSCTLWKKSRATHKACTILQEESNAAFESCNIFIVNNNKTLF